MKTKKILTIDFRAPCIYQKVSAVQGDSGVQIVCNLASITEHDGATVRVYAKKPSGLELYNDCALIDNKVIIDVTTQMIAEIGMTKCQIQITNGTDIITSYEFGISVEKSLVNSSAVESSNEFTALENALKKVDGLDISESEINFTDATERVDLITNEKLSVLIGKISKWLKGLKNIAFTGKYEDLSNLPTLGDSASKNTANNLTTETEGSVLDARQGMVLQEKITTINNDLGKKVVSIIPNLICGATSGGGHIKKSGNIVELYIWLRGITENAESGQEMYVLPDGYKTTITGPLIFPAVCGSGFNAGYMFIESSGSVKLVSNSTNIAYGHITFVAN